MDIDPCHLVNVGHPATVLRSKSPILTITMANHVPALPDIEVGLNASVSMQSDRRWPPGILERSLVSGPGL
jgi:hypothetical protein